MCFKTKETLNESAKNESAGSNCTANWPSKVALIKLASPSHYPQVSHSLPLPSASQARPHNERGQQRARWDTPVIWLPVGGRRQTLRGNTWVLRASIRHFTPVFFFSLSISPSRIYLNLSLFQRLQHYVYLFSSIHHTHSWQHEAATWLGNISRKKARERALTPGGGSTRAPPGGATPICSLRGPGRS